MILSIPFLATDVAQLDRGLLAEGHGVEATLFRGEDVMDDDRWALVRRNLRAVAALSPPSLTFHFPVEDADWVADAAVRDRLLEALDVVGELGFHGVVLHSNRIASHEVWRARDLERERDALGGALAALARRVESSSLWVGLENMPVTGNDAVDLDPLLVYPEDFAGLCGGPVGVTWDVCHYAYTTYVGESIAAGSLDHADDYPHLRLPVRATGATQLVPSTLHGQLRHAHLSAFTGIADRRRRTTCTEGELPGAGPVGEQRYADALLALRAASVRAVTLEVQEVDYTRRRRAPEMVAWCRSVLGAAR